MRGSAWRLLAAAGRGVALCGALTFVVSAQEAQDSVAPPPQMHRPASGGSEERSAAPATVDVTPIARDEEIGRRLQSILDATGWFTGARVQVDTGVVFLSGQTETDELRKWAGDLARNTQDVVAVANRIEVSRPSVWDMRPARAGLFALWRDFIHSWPLFFFGMIILALSVGAGMVVTRTLAAILAPHIQARLLRSVFARGAGILVVLAGTYVVLRVSGLTQLASGPQGKRAAAAPAEDSDAVSTPAEAGLYSEAIVIEAQARHAQPLEGGENLLAAAPGHSTKSL